MDKNQGMEPVGIIPLITIITVYKKYLPGNTSQPEIQFPMVSAGSQFIHIVTWK